MPEDRFAFTRSFATAVRRHRATIFAGAGISVGAGLPDWKTLVAPILDAAHVPAGADAPLAMEYAARHLGGDGAVKVELQRPFAACQVPAPIHGALVALGARELWTTNYDALLENAAEANGREVQLITSKDSYQDGRGDALRITKMHGSLDAKHAKWLRDPVISRSHFERYEQDQPEIWAALRAQYLTTSFLFVGFGFDDPNINVLLRLSRQLAAPGAPTHYAILRRPDREEDVRLHDLRVEDLERSQVRVLQIADYQEIDTVIQEISVLAREPNLFLSGSGDSTLPAAIGTRLAAMHPIPMLTSFAGPTALEVARGLRDGLAPSRYKPESIRFYYRKATSADEKVTHDHRVGTIVFTNLDLEEMREEVLPRCRAMLVVGGGNTTAAEAEFARSRGAAIIPLILAGGTGQRLYESLTAADANIPAAVHHYWDGLGDNAKALDAAMAIIESMMRD